MVSLCWFLSPRQLGQYGLDRGNMLDVLDALGKWSLIDVYVLVLTMVAFQVHVQNEPGSELIDDRFFTVDAFVQPMPGLYCFLCGIMLSLISTNIAVAYHRVAT